MVKENTRIEYNNMKELKSQAYTLGLKLFNWRLLRFLELRDPECNKKWETRNRK